MSNPRFSVIWSHSEGVGKATINDAYRHMDSVDRRDFLNDAIIALEALLDEEYADD